MKILAAHAVLTLLAATPLLAGCLVAPVEDAPPTDTPILTSTATETPVWFPATPTPSPFPTPVVSPTIDLRTGVGDLLVEDDFSDATLWSTSTDNNAAASVSNGKLNLSLKSAKSYLISIRNTPSFMDFYAEVTASPNFCHGEDEYGLIVRSLDGSHYRFALSCDGRAKVDRSYNGALSRQAGWLANGIIPNLAPSSSKLAVWAGGGQMHFFVNDFYLFTVTDSLLYKGNIGVYVHTSGEDDASVSFSNLKVWQVVR